MITKRILIIGLLFLTLSSFSQKNPFLDRAYWKSNPSIQDIDNKIAEGHDVSALTSAYFDAVSYALIEKVNNKTIKHLLSKEGNGVNKLTHDGRTYIFWAAYKDNLEMMKYLVDQGAKTDIIDSHGYSLLNFAATTGQINTKLYDFCISHGANPKQEKNHDGANALLLVAPFIKDLSLIQYFTSKGIDLKTTDNRGNGIFNYAAKAGNVKLMDFLVKQGIPYKELNKVGGNAMIFASRGTRGHTNSLETYEYLERLGITPNVVTEDGVTPLHSIAYRGKDLGIFNYFLSKGVNVNQPNKDGNTPFMNASYLNNVTIVKHLLPHVKDINTQNRDGKSALTHAIQRNSPEVVTLLLNNGANLNTLDKDGNNLSYYLIKSYSPSKEKEFKQKVTILSIKGFNFVKSQGDGSSLYHLAVDKNNMDLLKWVTTNKIDINGKDKNGITPLHKAVMTAKNLKVIKYLLSVGADKSVKTDFDESVYDLASENEILKKNNIDIEFLKAL